MLQFKKTMYGSGTTALVISNKELNDIMKIAQALEDHSILNKGVTSKIRNEVKKSKRWIFRYVSR